MVVDGIKCTSPCVWHIVGALSVLAVIIYGSARCGTQASWLTGVRCLDSTLLHFSLLYHGHLPSVIISFLEEGKTASSSHCPEHIRGAE